MRLGCLGDIIRQMGMKATRFRFQLKGGHPCLDFANTVSYRLDVSKRVDHLTALEDLLHWAVQAGIVNERKATMLFSKSDLSPKEAEGVFKRALRLREAIYGAFSAIAHRREPKSSDFATIHAELRIALRRKRIVGSLQRGYRWEWDTSTDDLDSLLWSIVEAAANLLVSSRVHSVRECAASDCGWLFLDRSSSQRRRWCDMKDCGNRAKARRYYYANKLQVRSNKDGNDRRQHKQHRTRRSAE
jgi:predicted RNA-binding Zn ribbon-like protein